jgi:hypothetical protein
MSFDRAFVEVLFGEVVFGAVQFDLVLSEVTADLHSGHRVAP